MADQLEDLDSDPPPASGDALSLSALAHRLTAVERVTTRLRAAIGVAPDPSARPPVEGTGIRGAQAEILSRLDGISARLDVHFAALEAAQKARSDRLSRAAWIVVGALLVAGVGYLVSLAGRLRLAEGPREVPCLATERQRVGERRA